MEIAQDFIAAVQGPEWKYALSRIAIDTDGNGVVFVAGSGVPIVTFTAGTMNTSRGSGTTADGETVEWRRRGSSCQYKLAKCKVSTETIAAWWEAAKLL